MVEPDTRRAGGQRHLASADHAAHRGGEHQPAGRRGAGRQERVPGTRKRVAAIGTGNRQSHRHHQERRADPPQSKLPRSATQSSNSEPSSDSTARRRSASRSTPSPTPTSWQRPSASTQRSRRSNSAIPECTSPSFSISKASFEKRSRRSSTPPSTARCWPSVIILLFLHSWRSTLIVAVSLPVSVLGTLFAAYVLGYSLNIMTLGGLALAVGLIVDDAIVVIENIYRHMARGQTPMEAAETATAEIFSAVLASSITVITVFVPLVLIPGLQGLHLHAVRRDGHGRRRALARRRGDPGPDALVGDPAQAHRAQAKRLGERTGLIVAPTRVFRELSTRSTSASPVGTRACWHRRSTGPKRRLCRGRHRFCGHARRREVRRGENRAVSPLELELRSFQPADADRHRRFGHERNGRSTSKTACARIRAWPTSDRSWGRANSVSAERRSRTSPACR